MAKAKVQVEYRYYVQAGRNGSTYQTIAEEAEKIAVGFFDSQEHETIVSVQGRQENFSVECVTRAIVEVDV